MATEQVGAQFSQYTNSFRSLASKDFPGGYSKSVCVRLHSESSEPTMFSQATPDEHPPTPPPCRWPALLTLPTLAKFQLVWRRLWDPVLFPSSRLVEHTVTTVCVLPEYQPIKKRRNAMCIRIFSDPSKCPFFFDPTCIVLKPSSSA